MTKKEKLLYLYRNLENDIVNVLETVNVTGKFTDKELHAKAKLIMYNLYPYSKELKQWSKLTMM